MPSASAIAIHVHFDGELRLRRAEAAERAVGRRVGAHRAARGCARSGSGTARTRE